MENKFIILGAGRPYRGDEHSALCNTSDSIRVLDWTLQSTKNINPEYYFITGYQADKIEGRYLEFNYLYNPLWESTKAGWSLLLGLDSINDHACYVSYSDILFHQNTIEKFGKSVGFDVEIAVDSHWRTRYTGRSETDLKQSEKVCVAEDTVTLLGSTIPVDIAHAEFIGLVHFSTRAVKQLKDMYRDQSKRQFLQKASLSDLIEFLRLTGLSIKAIDVLGDWAQLNEPADLARFVLGTKAQTLYRLRGMVKKSVIEDQVSFTTADWLQDKNKICQKIKNKFQQQRLVIRSSALSEDGFAISNAGAYTSLLNIDSSEDQTLIDAIIQVINSYPDKNPENQVLVQPMLCNVLVSGVVFTRSLASGAPYYTVNYDDVTGSTESITSGSSKEHKTLLIRRDATVDNANIPEQLKVLLPALREIESLLSYDSLDIEFALTHKGLHILQVRPIAVDHSKWDTPDAVFYRMLQTNEDKFNRSQVASPFICGDKAFYGVMPDWNPAEIIGTKPGRLAQTLYRFLIMDDVWARQRAEYGYRDVRPQPLLTMFAGQPYVDVRASFNSFIPKQIPESLATKLVNFYLSWLENNPHLHDKVEFDVVPTCYALNFNKWEQRLSVEGGFSDEDILQLKAALLEISTNAIKRENIDLEKIALLEQRFHSIKSSECEPFNKIWLLLNDCREYGALPFAHLARSAFVAVTLLKTAVESSVITQAELNDFLNSIRTVSHTFSSDALKTAEGSMSWHEFIECYGHLRPGTYDITSLNYAAEPERYLKPIVAKAEVLHELDNESGTLWANARHRFLGALHEQGLIVDIETIEQFMRCSIEGREYAKFMFTKNLSLAMDLLVDWGEANGINREELSQISINDILSVHTALPTAIPLGDWLKSRATEGIKLMNELSGVELPPLICSQQDFSVFLYPSTQANFIGSSLVSAECIDLSIHNNDKDLAGKIALIPQADPGYDWLFGRDIAGLITMYGGANSHMAIRAAEFGLPAAIGVGEVQYKKLAIAKELELNTANRTIRVIR